MDVFVELHDGSRNLKTSDRRSRPPKGFLSGGAHFS